MSADEEVIDLVPYEEEDSIDEARPLHRLIRTVLIALTVPWIIVFGVAMWIDPYKPVSRVEAMAKLDAEIKELQNIPAEAGRLADLQASKAALQAQEDEVQRAGTHQQLGLPECNFKAMVGAPCPSCGMTTSFALLMHADVWNSLKANFAGTALCAFGLVFVPWAFASAFFGRFVFIRHLELVVFRLALIFLVVLFGRWIVVLIMDLFFSA